MHFSSGISTRWCPRGWGLHGTLLSKTSFLVKFCNECYTIHLYTTKNHNRSKMGAKLPIFPLCQFYFGANLKNNFSNGIFH